MTIGLCIISPDYATAKPIVDRYQQYFDEVYVQTNQANDGKHPYYKWNDNFADARNALLKEVKTDYWAWIDTDDTIEGIEHLRDLVEDMEAQGVDRMFMQYDYAKNDIDEEIAPHWRERIMRTAHPYKWLGPVHETLVTAMGEKTAKTELVKVIHHKDQSDYDASIKRNHKILEREYAKEPRDPRITMYLGMSHFTMRDWDKANTLLLEHIRTSGSPEDKYRSWLKVAECHGKVEELEKAISACLEAMKLLPHYPDAYFGLGQFYYELEDYHKCLEWLKIGLSKPDPVTLSIVDPTLRYRTIMMGALAELQLGHITQAWELINHTLELSPNYALAKKFLPMFRTAYLEQEAIEHAKWLVTYVHGAKGKPEKILDALGDLALDIRLNNVRSKLYPPKVWPKRSIVFFCGPASEPWGPDMLEKGIGGSEEAIIYLSRELAKLGWSVTVYADREASYVDFASHKYMNDEPVVDWAVHYLPWHTFNPKDRFDVFIAWRNPQFFTQYQMSARIKGVDLHDTPIGHQTIRPEDEASIDKFFFKSQMQRKMGKVPDSKAVIISNGIVAAQFKED
jgi:tetratricopeptide (TPR) repeat protein